MERFEQPTDSRLEGLKEWFDKAAAWAKTTALIAMLNVATLESKAIDGKEDIAKTDEKIEKANIPVYVDTIMKKYEKDFDSIYTPQITPKNPDAIILNIAQVHKNPHSEPSPEEAKSTTDCQKQIEAFILEIMAEAKKKGDSVLCFDEGVNESFQTAHQHKVFTNALYMDMIASGELTFDQIEQNMIETFQGNSKRELAAKKYAFYTFIKRMVISSKNITPEKLADLKAEADKRLAAINIDDVYYSGALTKLSDEKKIYVHEAESDSVLNESIKIFIHNIYEGPKIDALNKEMGEVTTSIKNEKDPRKKTELEAKKKELLEEVAKEKTRIREAAMEDRENVAVQKIAEAVKNEREEKKKGKIIVILNYGAAHDFHNNVKEKNPKTGLLRINPVNRKTRDLYKVRN